MRRVAAAGAVLIAVVPLSLVAARYREGPLPKMTGGFGEQTCHTCHFDNRVNTAGGSLQVDGLPSAFVPGHEYAIAVTIRRQGVRRAGFELTARVATGKHAGEQAGTLRGEDKRTQIVFAPGGHVQYIQHTKLGSDLVNGDGRWTVYWTAPSDDVDQVLFNVAGNAANDDASALGDFIYTLAKKIRRATSFGSPSSHS